MKFKLGSGLTVAKDLRGKLLSSTKCQYVWFWTKMRILQININQPLFPCDVLLCSQIEFPLPVRVLFWGVTSSTLFAVTTLVYILNQKLTSRKHKLSWGKKTIVCAAQMCLDWDGECVCGTCRTFIWIKEGRSAGLMHTGLILPYGWLMQLCFNKAHHFSSPRQLTKAVMKTSFL